MTAMARLVLISVLIAAALTAPRVEALETDQYWAWGRPLADSTDAVNARFNLELERAIASFPEHRQPTSCREISIAYRKRMRSLLLHEIQVWIWNTRWVERAPDGGEESREYAGTNLFSRHPLIDPATWMPYSPTIEIGGVRIGIDKLSHMVSSGWTYYGEYNKGLADGESSDEATRRAVRRGLVEESLILGKATAGVFSVSDMEASLAGIRFYRDLCDVPDPVLELGDGGWTIVRRVDIGRYVAPRWDESFQPPVYSKGRWRKVRPVLESYCDRRSVPEVIARRESYRDNDQPSLVSEMVAEMVAEGKLEDPSRFGLDAVCPDPPPMPGDFRGAPTPPATKHEISPSEWRDRVVSEEGDRRRWALGLPGAQLSYPLAASASIAVMPVSQPAGWDCTTPCDFKGPFAQLEAGLGGGRFSLGWGYATGSTNRSGSLMNKIFIGAAYKVTLLRTWGGLNWVEVGRTYAGLELTIPVAQAKVGLGVLYRVDGEDGRWLVTGGAGWGF